ncbi:MAG: hypothetical protein M0Z48_06180 [Nitrospiraceae bacterium]|nr:hypothetical protein [Nitrospiraceae bacterium]
MNAVKGEKQIKISDEKRSKDLKIMISDAGYKIWTSQNEGMFAEKRRFSTAC